MKITDIRLQDEEHKFSGVDSFSCMTINVRLLSFWRSDLFFLEIDHDVFDDWILVSYLQCHGTWDVRGKDEFESVLVSLIRGIFPPMARHLTAVVVDRAFEVSDFIVICQGEFDRATCTLTFGVLNDCALDFVGMVNGI